MAGVGQMLSGLRVVVTRPSRQAQALSDLLEDAGARVFRYPVIEIAPPRDGGPLRALAGRLDAVDWLIFVSANAVQGACELLKRGLPETLKVAAVGPATAKEAERCGVRKVRMPEENFSSEGLLQLPDFSPGAVAGAGVVIVRGEDGRGQLAATLRERGAAVEYVASYRRVLPGNGAGILGDAWAGGGLDLFIVTSNEGLQNLCDMVGPEYRDRLLETPLVVISARAAELARQLGFHGDVVIAETASDDGLLAAVREWRRQTSGAAGKPG